MTIAAWPALFHAMREGTPYSKGGPVQIVLKRFGNTFSVITMYANDNFSSFLTLRAGDTLLWKR